MIVAGYRRASADLRLTSPFNIISHTVFTNPGVVEVKTFQNRPACSLPTLDYGSIAQPKFDQLSKPTFDVQARPSSSVLIVLTRGSIWTLLWPCYINSGAPTSGANLEAPSRLFRESLRLKRFIDSFESDIALT
jgi:hypothetical protein